jgi:uncharacterized protein (DUF2252 family)
MTPSYVKVDVYEDQRMGVVEKILKFNQGREPERLSMKYQRMSTSAFVFYRGTCHLFYDDLPKHADFNKAPAAWICGDMHIENFGTFKGSNRLTYFDMNDFDEACLAPCTWDPVRLIACLPLALDEIGLNAAEARRLGSCFLENYSESLRAGKAKWIERATSQGLIFDLLTALRKRNRRKFLERSTELKAGKRKLVIDGKHLLAERPKRVMELRRLLAQFHASKPNPRFYRLLDAARRIAGTGSLGVLRDAMLVEGKGAPNKNYILDLKQAAPSAVQPHSPCTQPKWESEAVRAVAIQKRVQAMAPAFLEAAHLDGAPYILHELIPLLDRVDLKNAQGDMARLEMLLRDMADIAAWACLRSSGRQGSAIADELIDFGHDKKWRKPLLDYGLGYSKKVRRDYNEYKEAYDAGQVKAEGLPARRAKAASPAD